MSNGVDYYDLQSAKDDLQRQVWDLERKLEREIEDNRQAARDSFVDVRAGIGDLHAAIADLNVRLIRLEESSGTSDG